MDINKIIKDTENLIKLISKSAATISDEKVKEKAEKWVADYSSGLFGIFEKQSKEFKVIQYLTRSVNNQRLIKKKWCKGLKDILKNLKTKQIFEVKQERIKKYDKYIFPKSLLNKIRKQDKKISILGSEVNFNWQTGCWNACGILMRIILERILDKKDRRIKEKIGLEQKINYCLSNKIFGRSVSEALQKLRHSTKITGDIVAHDSNILLSKNDIELSIVPLNILVKDVLKL